MRSRFIEVQDEHHTNHGKFWLMQFGEAERKYRSAVTNTPLLACLPAVQRFGGSLSPSSIFMLDLQTHEGMLFDPTEDVALVRRRFLVHPLHVCILYFPLMLHLAEKRGDVWKLPNLITLPMDDVIEQPGVLVDARGQQVRCRSEWSPRHPLIARLRNREVPDGGDPEEGQNLLTHAELQEASASAKPVWQPATGKL